MAGFNERRLNLARRRRGLTKQQLASEGGVSRRMVTAYERGEKHPSDPTLRRIAALLRYPIGFFEGDDLDEPPVDGTSFRALSTMTARTRGQAGASSAIALALDDWLGERFGLPQPDVPRYAGADPEMAAETVRSEWGLGERSIKSMIQTLEAHGVRVFSLPEECASIDAFSFWRDDRPYVFLNTRKSPEHSRMDGAHELGHLVLHWKGGAHGRDTEREAAQFGSAFLMPCGSVLASAPVAGTLPQLIKAKRKWSVSLAALTYRMHELKMLTDWQYRTLFVQMSRRGYRTNEPDGIKPEQSQVLAKVFRALKSEGITKADVARELQISFEDLNDVIFGLVLTPVRASKSSNRQMPQEKSVRPVLRTL